MGDLRHPWLVTGALALLLTAAACLQKSSAQVVGDSACPAYAVDIASFATCDGDRVAGADGIERVSPQRAYELKQQHGRAVLLIDVRSKAEALLAGAPLGIDAVVPLAEIAVPLRWDAERRDLQFVDEPNFSAVAQAWVAALGGDERTPLLLICRDEARALRAAQRLQVAGHASAAVVSGGFEGALGADGRRHGGWKDAGLPWTATVDATLVFGASD